MDTLQEELRLVYKHKVIIISIIVLILLIFLYNVRSILPPFLWAAVTAYLLTPIVNWLSRQTRLPRMAVLATLYLVFGAAIGWALFSLIPFLLRELGDFRASVPFIVASVQKEVLGAQRFEFLGIVLDPQSISTSILQSFGALPMGALRVVRETATFIAEILIYVVVTFYLVADAPRIRDSFFRLFPTRYRPEAMVLLERINRVLGAYIRGQFFLIALMSTATWIFLGLILKVRFALVLSLLTGVLEIIPFIGPITAGAIATSVALFQPNDFGWPNLGFAGVVVLVYFVLRHTEDYLVIPNVIGRIVALHPIVVIFSVLAGVVLGGILGMVIAVPVAAAMKVVMEYLYSKLVS